MLPLKYLVAVALTIVLSACGRQQPIQAKQDPGPIVIQTAPVTIRQIQRVVESVGTLFPYDESVISAEIDGHNI